MPLTRENVLRLWASEEYKKLSRKLIEQSSGDLLQYTHVRSNITNPDIVLIDELEYRKRKLYAGGVGYFSGNGDMDTCIALRTGLIKNKKIYVQAGAGIVADSVPEKEYQETINKAKALLEASK